jgi:cell division protein FtsB
VIEKIKNYQSKILEEVRIFQDVRALGIAMFLVIALLISWSGVKVIETNYSLQKEIAQMEQETAVRRLENRNLELENQYFETDEYLELEARKNFGLAAPGETVLVVPKTVALKNVVPEENLTIPGKTAEKKKHKWQQNVDAWMDFLLHKNATN